MPAAAVAGNHEGKDKTKSANLQEICACEGELWFVSVEASEASEGASEVKSEE